MINEGIESYKIDLLPCDKFVMKYGFTDMDGNDYLVQFKNDSTGPKNSILGSSYELTYFVWDEDILDWNIDKIVNTNIFRVTKTVFGDVITSFLNSKPWVKTLRFEGIPKETEGKYVITKRTKLYIRYLKNNPIEGYRLKNNMNRISLIKTIS
jgi:hypothetical protein